MLRLALVLALVAGIAALVVNFVVTKPAIEQQTQKLGETTQQLASMTEAKGKAETEAKVAKANAEKAGRELSETKTALETASTEASLQKTRADKLATDLSKTAKERNEANQELARWQVLGIQPEQVTKLQADFRDASDARAALNEEKRIFIRDIASLQTRLSRYEGGDEKPVEMPGLKGSVIAVDPKWDFVLLDVGADQGAKEHGVVMVRHGDKLIGKARIVSVEKDRSYANLLPDWKQGDVAVAEGDKILY
ncbi:MAG TPA: hypothetical protein VMB21_16165 [Candidatus Limnocylindria bacterium]|jgi:hypothetical protein|nr:hypothetical protein [Candidatus Limnocylindria bacterium]